MLIVATRTGFWAWHSSISHGAGPKRQHSLKKLTSLTSTRILSYWPDLGNCLEDILARMELIQSYKQSKVIARLLNERLYSYLKLVEGKINSWWQLRRICVWSRWSIMSCLYSAAVSLNQLCPLMKMLSSLKMIVQLFWCSGSLARADIHCYPQYFIL